jgi:hypothetical protein
LGSPAAAQKTSLRIAAHTTCASRGSGPRSCWRNARMACSFYVPERFAFATFLRDFSTTNVGLRSFALASRHAALSSAALFRSSSQGSPGCVRSARSRK